MSKKVKIKGKLRLFLNLLLILGIVLAIFDVFAFIFMLPAGLVIAIFLVIYFGLFFIFWNYIKSEYIQELVSFATEYGQVQKCILDDFELPYALLDDKGKILWSNKAFEELVMNVKGFRKGIMSVFPEVTRDKLPLETSKSEVEIEFEARAFLAKMRKIEVSDMVPGSDFAEMDDNHLIGFYLFDETALKYALQEIDDQSLAVGLIYIDNFDELIEKQEKDVFSSILPGLIDRTINKSFTSVDGIVRKIEKDKFFIILRKKSLSQLKERRFDILDEIKNASTNLGIKATASLSIGIGLDGDSFTKNSELARAAIDLAMGRGGDQAVIKTPESISIFGGKNQKLEKNTRVKARSKAEGIREILENKDMVFVMGHSNPDVDSFGAQVGMACVAKKLNKKIYLVLDKISPSMQSTVDLYLDSMESPEDIIIRSSEALEKITDHSTLVVVDTNTPDRTECAELVQKSKSLIVIDHHRQTEKGFDNPALSYVEPYASSTCEMIAEVLQYIDNGVKLKGYEADIMYYGIVMDTNSFTSKTGVRTFEAAAYLRRSGADVTRVQSLNKEDFTHYINKVNSLKNAFIYKKEFAIAVSECENPKDATVVCAQIADDLLKIKDIKASFAFTEIEGGVSLSLRASEEVNVQIIAEKFGGGGHGNAAGAQFMGKSKDDIDGLISQLEQTLDEMAENNEI